MDTHTGTGINMINVGLNESIDDNNRVMQITITGPEGEGKVVKIAESMDLDSWEISVAALKFAEPTVLDNTNVVSMLVPAYSSAVNGIILCPTIIHTTRIAETVIANATNQKMTLKCGDTMGIITQAGSSDLSIDTVKSKQNEVTDVDIIHDYLSEAIDKYVKRSSLLKVLK